MFQEAPKVSVLEFKTQTTRHVRLSLSHQAKAKILSVYPIQGVEIVCNPNRILDDLMCKEIKHHRVIHPSKTRLSKIFLFPLFGIVCMSTYPTYEFFQ